MPKSLQEYLKEPYARILIPDEQGGYSAEILEFPGCVAEGETADETIQALERAAESWIQAALDQGQNIPEPLMNQGYGGKIALRLPRSLHRQAARMAERDGVSLNQFFVSAIAARVGAEEFYNRMAERLEERWSIVPNTISLLGEALQGSQVLAAWFRFPTTIKLEGRAETNTVRSLPMLSLNALWSDNYG
jgi:predicted RNase H-like HicB family nuclease